MYIWIALLILTGITVWVAQYDLGAMNVWVALGIATVKSSLVVAVFMHMKYENRLFKLSLLAALAILAIFIGLTFFDVLYR
jgi:cytochrome c oxidase subunit 4